MKRLSRWLVPISLVLASAAHAGDSAKPYALNEASEFAQGCFPPCLCPLLVSSALTGGFTLVDDGVDPLFQHFLVEGFNVTVSFSGATKHIVGEGTYLYGGEVALLQRMQLDLSIGGGAVQHYDSGWVSFSESFPTIDLAVSINGIYCNDTVLWIVAKPQPSNPYDLDGDGTVGGGDLAIVLGAWGPCPQGGGCQQADFNGDGAVNGADLSLLLGAWGT